jgi:N-acetyl sugar amidotransferase
MTLSFRACTNCVLDTKDDPSMTFNEAGVCNYCTSYQDSHSHYSPVNRAEKEKELRAMVETIKRKGEGREYDCILGISGGVDSTYLAYVAKELGLRALIVHYDNGWNSELAVKNIENIAKELDFDLFTYVNDWEEFADLQLAFFRASVIDIELLTDHAISGILFKIARERNIRYILTGSNNSTEGILPANWYHWKSDALNISAIHKRFGKKKITTYPLLGFFERLYYTRVLGIRMISLLDYIDYVKEDAKKIITEKVKWRDYGGKHHESVFTRFYQSYILPRKFGVDKRKAHLSSLIVSGQMTRDEALEELKKDIYEKELLRQDKAFVLKKLGLSEEEFEEIMNLPVKQHTDYPTYLDRHYKYEKKLSRFLKPFKKLLKRTG